MERVTLRKPSSPEFAAEVLRRIADFCRRSRERAASFAKFMNAKRKEQG